MLKFNKVVALDKIGMTDLYLKKIGELCNVFKIYIDDPENEEEIILRCKDADCILVSWRTKITKNIISSLPTLKYIATCYNFDPANSKNIDIDASNKAQIIVKGIGTYGDQGTVEFIFGQLIGLYQGFGKYKWSQDPTELANKKFGIIGLGKIGREVATVAAAFNAKVFYYSRTRQLEIENENLTYLSLGDLIPLCDILSLHLPSNTLAINELHFNQMKKNVVLINTSVGLPFKEQVFIDWIQENSSAYAIFDKSGIGSLSKTLTNFKNVIVYDRFSGLTLEARHRLSKQVYENLMA